MEKELCNVDNIVVDGLSRDLFVAGRFCFGCEQIFASRKCVEEHICPATTYICSCGTEFTEYKDMEEHDTTHEPGHQVLDHETIWKRRLEKRKAEEEQLKRIETGDVIWNASKMANVASVDSALKPSRSLTKPPTLPQVSNPPVKISQVPASNSSSQGNCQSNPAPSGIEMKNVFGSAGAPTVDLWTLYQPVVLLKTTHTHPKMQLYTCGRCGERFVTKVALVAHHSTHVIDKVCGCIGCGLLLSSKKLVPRFHVCNAPNNIQTKLKVITAKPLKSNPVQKNSSLDLPQNAGHTQAFPTPQSKSLTFSHVSKGSTVPPATSSQQFKNKNVKVYSQSSRRLLVRPLLPKTSNPHVLNAGSTVPYSAMAHRANVGVYDKSSNSRLMTVPGLMKAPLIPASGVSKNKKKTSPVPRGFTCRVCYIPFETSTLLQRHKCTKAEEFMAKQNRPGKQQYRRNNLTAAPGSSLAPVNGERTFGLHNSANIKQNQGMAVSLNQGHGALQVHCKTEADMEDDCYIVEPEKTAEMIYQVTSSVPIKT